MIRESVNLGFGRIANLDRVRNQGLDRVQETVTETPSRSKTEVIFTIINGPIARDQMQSPSDSTAIFDKRRGHKSAVQQAQQCMGTLTVHSTRQHLGHSSSEHVAALHIILPSEHGMPIEHEHSKQSFLFFFGGKQVFRPRPPKMRVPMKGAPMDDLKQSGHPIQRGHELGGGGSEQNKKRKAVDREKHAEIHTKRMHD